MVANVKRANPDWAITLAEREMIFLGLLPRGTDYHRIIFQGVAGQLLGLYDYYSGVLYVRREANRVFGPDRWAIAHEYTHALQDQHYGAQRLMPDENRLTYRNSDALEAHHALAEGDATNTQYLFISREYTPLQIQQLYSEAPIYEGEITAIPENEKIQAAYTGDSIQMLEGLEAPVTIELPSGSCAVRA